jgi:hypothetical protein
MRKGYIFLLISLCITIQNFCDAQTMWKHYRKEFFFGGGATNFLGDLGGANQVGTYGIKDFNWPAVRPDFIVGYRYRTTRQTALKTNLIYARLAGDDKFTQEPFRENRNCNFRTPCAELSEQFEYCIVRERTHHIYNLKGVRGWKYIQMTTYFFGGAGLMYFNPKGEWNGKWYPLRPLSTEGEGLVATRKKYSLVQFVIPFGMGFKFALSDKWSVGIEYGIRKTFTDYVDDVSKSYFSSSLLLQEKGPTAVHFANPTTNTLGAYVTRPGEERGDPTHKDSYMLAIISFYYKIPRGAFTLPKYR